MDEALKKSGDYPNIALTPGTHRHAATGEAVEIPGWARVDNTCSNVSGDISFECSVCGADCYIDWCGGGLGSPRFCPSCGRKVVEE